MCAYLEYSGNPLVPLPKSRPNSPICGDPGSSHERVLRNESLRWTLKAKPAPQGDPKPNAIFLVFHMGWGGWVSGTKSSNWLVLFLGILEKRCCPLGTKVEATGVLAIQGLQGPSQGARPALPPSPPHPSICFPAGARRSICSPSSCQFNFPHEIF